MTNANLGQNNAQHDDLDNAGDNNDALSSKGSLSADDPLEDISMEDIGLDHMGYNAVFSVKDDADAIAACQLDEVDEEVIEQKCFHWEIDNWDELPDCARGPVHVVGGHEWNLLLLQNNTNASHISVYLELTNAKIKPDEWACAQFAIVASSVSDPTNYCVASAKNHFYRYASDWGFATFAPLDRLSSSNEEQLSMPILENGTLRLSAIVQVVNDPTGVLWMNSFAHYDSKSHTGFVGLRNQGATCYMNSLFQALYCTNAFRKAVYQIPTESDIPTDSIALALQRLFYNLQFTSTAVDTVEMTQSFGWNSSEAFMQHDIQEFNRVLQDRLEEKMKGTPADGAIKRLFVGRTKSYIRCINVDYESTRSEDYYDIQLNVKGCKNLDQSFKEYIAEEMMDGDNKYMADKHGLQDAKMGVTFESFPPVLHLQLKRFEYDMARDRMVKINDRHEFPMQIDLAPYLSSSSDRSQSHVYVLHGVLVHSGYLGGGHYFAFVKPTKDGQWLKFDDDHVVPATLKEVLEYNYGGDYVPREWQSNRWPGKQSTKNAYMLVYIRECMLDEILADVEQSDIPDHIGIQLEKERLAWELEQKARELAHLFIKTSVFTSISFMNNRGLGLFPKDGMQWMRNLYLPKHMTYASFKQEVARCICLRPSDFYTWSLITRCNNTFRVDARIDDIVAEATTLEELQKKFMTGKGLYLYIQLSIEQGGIPLLREKDWCPATDDDEEEPLFIQTEIAQEQPILVFLKRFDPEGQNLRGVCSMQVYKCNRIDSVMDRMRKLASYPGETRLMLYEEESPAMVKRLNVEWTFGDYGIDNGDIICVQRQVSVEEMFCMRNAGQYPTAREYMRFLHCQVDVNFCTQRATGEYDDQKTFPLTLCTDMICAEIAQKLAEHLQVHPEYVQLLRPGSVGESMWVVVRRHSTYTLKDLLHYCDPDNVWLSYRLLDDMTVTEYESQRVVRITVCRENLARSNCHTLDISIPRTAHFRQLLDRLQTVTGHDLESGTGRARFIGAIKHQWICEYGMDDLVASFTEGSVKQLYAEPVPEDELSLQASATLIPVFHFDHHLGKKHSLPFRLAIIKDEPFSETRKRLQSRTGMNAQEWSKVEFLFVNGTSTACIEDNDVLSDRPYTPEKSTAIGLSHPDRSTPPAQGGFQRELYIRG